MYMFKIGLFLLFTLKLSLLFAQQSWEFIDQSNENQEFIVHSIESKEGNCVSVSNEYIFDDVLNDAIYTKSFIRINDVNSGQLFAQTEYVIDSLSSRLFWIFYDAYFNNYIIAGGAQKVNENETRGYFLVTKWDENLNFISDTIVELKPNINHEIWYLSGNMKKENEFLLVGYSSHMINDIPTDTRILTSRLNAHGDIDEIEFHHTNKDASSIFYDTEKNQYVLFSTTTYYLDSELKIQDSLYSSDCFTYNNGYLGQATKFNENKYLVSTRYNGGNERGIAFFDTDLNYLNGIKIDRDTPFDASIIKPNFDYIDTSEIYFGNFDAFQNHFSIAKVNSSLKPYWIKHFSLNDSLKHYVWSISSITGGGCIVSGGIRYVYTDSISRYYPWILKIDQDGNNVSANEIEMSEQNIKVYPNPSTGKIIFEPPKIIGLFDVKILNNQGQEVFVKVKMVNGDNISDLSFLPPGLYFWLVFKDSFLIDSGRWIKK